MKRINKFLCALLSLALGSSLALSGNKAEGDLLTPVKGVRGLPQVKRSAPSGDFFYETFESLPDGETGLPQGWTATSTPGFDDDIWTAGTLGLNGTPMNGTSGYKYAFILGNPAGAHDSWLFSPLTHLEGGKEYILEFWTYLPSVPNNTGDIKEKLQVFVGTGQSADRMLQPLELIECTNMTWEVRYYSYTPDQTGDYCLGFHSMSQSKSNATVIDDVKIYTGTEPMYFGEASIDMGETDRITGRLESYYYCYNNGEEPLKVSLEAASEGLTVEGLPITLDTYARGDIKITYEGTKIGQYEGYIKLNTNDPTLPAITIPVSAMVKEAYVTGYTHEDFEQGGPKGWDLSYGSGNVFMYGGRNSSRSFYSTCMNQDDDRNEKFDGVGFITQYVEMGDNPELGFWYKITTHDSKEKAAEADRFRINVSITDDNGKTWKPVRTYEPGSEYEHNAVADWQYVNIPLDQYAGKTCRVKLSFRQIKGIPFMDTYRVLVDDVTLGSAPLIDVAANDLRCDNKMPAAGESVSMTATVSNLGSKPVSNLTVYLINAETGYDMGYETGLSLAPGETKEIQIQSNALSEGPLHVVAEAWASEDGYEENNSSYPVHLAILPQNNTPVDVFIPTQTDDDRLVSSYYPLNYQGVESASQTIYKANEIGVSAGKIGSLVFYYNQKADFYASSFEVLIGETDGNDFAGRKLVDPKSLTKVFEGPAYLYGGTGSLVIPFDAPFAFSGRNLVVMTRKIGTEFVNNATGFYVRRDRDNLRSITAEAGSGTLVASGYSNTVTSDVVPEITFNVIKESTVDVTGTITDAKGPVEGAQVGLEGTSIFVKSDAEGHFTLPQVALGNVRLSVEKHGYRPYVSETLTLESTGTNNFNLTIEAYPTCKFYGTITEKESGEAVENARVSLKGYDDFVTYTDAEGRYEIEGIAGDTGSDYQLHVSSDYCATLLDNISIESDLQHDMALGLKPLCVHNVQARLDGGVTVTWDNPMPELARDNGVVAENIGWSFGSTNRIVGTVYKRHISIKEVSWYIVGGTAHEDFNVFIFGLDASGAPDVKNLLYIARNVDFQDDAWNSLVLDRPIEVDGCFVAISSTYFMGLGVSKPTEEDPFEEGQSYFAGDDYTWTITPMSNFGAYHPMIRLYGEIGGEASSAQVQPRKVAASRPAPEYKVYRFIVEWAGVPAKWTLVGTTTANSFTDTEVHADRGDFRYAVVACYPDGESVARMTRTLKSSGVNETLFGESPVVSEQYFDITGARLSEAPAAGICIVRRVHADGTVTTAKIIK